MFTRQDTITELNAQGYIVSEWSDSDIDIAVRLMNDENLFNFTPDEVRRGRELGMFA